MILSLSTILAVFFSFHVLQQGLHLSLCANAIEAANSKGLLSEDANVMLIFQ